MRKFGAILLAAIFVLGASILMAKPVVIVWQSEGYGLEAVKSMVEKLAGVELVIKDFPYNDLRTKLQTTLFTQDPSVAPDIVMIDSIWLGEFVEGGFVADVTDAVADIAQDWFKSFREGSQWPPASGRYYGLWYDTDIRVTFFWPDLLKEAGVNPGDLLYWDTYIKACKKLKTYTESKGIGACWLDMAGPWAPDFEFFPYLWQEGGEILVEKNGKYEPAFNSKAGVKALQFLVDRVKSGIDPQTETFWGDDFAQKKWAVFAHGNWAASASRFPNTTAQDREKLIAVLPLPVSKPGKVPVTLAGGWIMTIPKVIKEKDLERYKVAVKVLRTFLRSDVMSEYYAKLARIPVRASVDNDKLSKSIEFFDFYMKIASVAKVRPAIPEWSQVSDAIFQAMSDAVFRGKDPKEALDQAAQRVRKILGR